MSSREDWQRRLGPLYGGAVALVSSTSWRWPTEVSDERRSSGWIVALGVPVGLAAWAVFALVKAAGLPSAIAALFGLAMLSIASAALVERGLAERVDHWTQAGQSTVPSVLVVVFTTLVRAAALVSVSATASSTTMLLLFVTTAVVGRWAAVFLQAIGDPIDQLDDTRRSFVATPSPAWLIAAISGGVVVLTLFGLGKAGIVAITLGAIVAFMLGLEAQRRDGGLSAPVVGTAAAIGEMLVLLIATIK